jgi:hypothetical protein
MRTALIVHLGLEANKTLSDPHFGDTFNKIVASLKPEAAYFFPSGGMRTMFFVFDLTSPDKIPPLVEPLWEIGATVDMHPAMNQDEVMRGLAAAAQARAK